jgi:hypothetical protein
MYNKKVLIDSLKKLGSAKAPSQKKDVIVDPMNQSTFNNGLSVKKSNIHGNGLFAEKPFKKGDLIGLAHVNNQPTPIVGNYHNHSEDNATALNISNGNKRYLVAAKDLEPGTEITTNYRLQPDLGQPEDFAKGGSAPSIPKTKSSKSYSRSLDATNRLFAEHPFFAKPKSRKNKIYDPNSKYYDEGGEPCPDGYIRDESGKCVWHDPDQENLPIDESNIHPVEYLRSQLTMGDPFYNTHEVRATDQGEMKWQPKGDIKSNIRNTNLNKFIQRDPDEGPGVESGYLHNNIWASPTLGLEKDTTDPGYAPNQLRYERNGQHPNVYFIKNSIKDSVQAPSGSYTKGWRNYQNANLTGSDYNKAQNEVGQNLLKQGYKGENMWGAGDEDQLYQLYGTEGLTLKGSAEVTPETLKYLESIKDSEEGKRYLAKIAGISEDDPDYADMLMHYNTTPIDVYAKSSRPNYSDIPKAELESDSADKTSFLTNTAGPVNYANGGLTKYTPGGASADPPDWLSKKGANVYFNPTYMNNFTGGTSTLEKNMLGSYRTGFSPVVGIEGSLSKSRRADQEKGRGWLYNAYAGLNPNAIKEGNFTPSAGLNFDFENAPQDKNFRPHVQLGADYNPDTGLNVGATSGARFAFTPYGNKRIKPGYATGHLDIYGGIRGGANKDYGLSGGVTYGARVHGKYMPERKSLLGKLMGNGAYFYGDAGIQFDPQKGQIGQKVKDYTYETGALDDFGNPVSPTTVRDQDSGLKFGNTIFANVGIKKNVDSIKRKKEKLTKQIQDVKDKEIEYNRLNPPVENGIRNTTFKYGGIPIELTQDEIKKYVDGGYIVEDISVPELNKMQPGGAIGAIESGMSLVNPFSKLTQLPQLLPQIENISSQIGNIIPTGYNMSNFTMPDLIAHPEFKLDPEILSNMSYADFANTLYTPSGELLVPPTDRNFSQYFSGNEAIIPTSETEYADIFNSRLDMLNNIIDAKNKSGIKYGVKKLHPNGVLQFFTPKQTIYEYQWGDDSPLRYRRFIENPDRYVEQTTGLKQNSKGKWGFDDSFDLQTFDTKKDAIDWAKNLIDDQLSPKPFTLEGGTAWSTAINPGQWRGTVQNIPMEGYFRRIPGLEMSASTQGVFPDFTPRRGTGTYESLNEYLTKMDLGRIKSGFNTQTAASRSAWENFIKSGRGYGYYGSPYVVHGILKKDGGIPQAEKGLSVGKKGCPPNCGPVSKLFSPKPPSNFVSTNFGPFVSAEHSANIARQAGANINSRAQVNALNSQLQSYQDLINSGGLLTNANIDPQEVITSVQDLGLPNINTKISKMEMDKVSEFLKTADMSNLDKYIDYPFTIMTPSGSLNIKPTTSNVEDNLWHFSAFIDNPRHAGLAFSQANKLFPYKNPSILEPVSLSLDSWGMLANMGRRPDWDMEFSDMIPLNNFSRHSKLMQGLPSLGVIGAGHFDKATGEEYLRRLNQMIAEKGLKEKAEWEYFPSAGDRFGMHRFMLPNYKLTRKYSKGGLQKLQPGGLIRAGSSLPAISSELQQIYSGIPNTLSSLNTGLNTPGLIKLSDFTSSFDPSTLDIKFPLTIKGDSGVVVLKPNTPSKPELNEWHFYADMKNPLEAGKAMLLADKVFPYINPTIHEQSSLSLDSLNLLLNMGKRKGWQMNYEDDVPLNWMHTHSNLFDEFGVRNPQNLNLLKQQGIPKIMADRMVNKLNKYLLEKGVQEDAYTVPSLFDKNYQDIYLPNFKLIRDYEDGGDIDYELGDELDLTPEQAAELEKYGYTLEQV